MSEMLEPNAPASEPTWVKSDHDGVTYLSKAIVNENLLPGIEVMPRVCVEVSIGTQTLGLTTEEARRWARVLVEAADRVDAGEGFAR